MEAVRWTTQLGAQVTLVGVGRHGIRVRLDDAATGARGPLTGPGLHLVDEGHVVERPIATRAKEERAPCAAGRSSH